MTKVFARWARKERLEDPTLMAAVGEICSGLVDADLGGGLLKKRVARRGGGKRSIFMYGFAKSERDNLDNDELRHLKGFAQSYLVMSEETMAKAVADGKI